MTWVRSLLSHSREGKLGLPEVVAMGVGGMVSGGIYAVLGVAMRQAGNAVPLPYLIAGAITLVTQGVIEEFTRPTYSDLY